MNKSIKKKVAAVLMAGMMVGSIAVPASAMGPGKRSEQAGQALNQAAHQAWAGIQSIIQK